jgi:hypothetical protein
LVLQQYFSPVLSVHNAYYFLYLNQNSLTQTKAFIRNILTLTTTTTDNNFFVTARVSTITTQSKHSAVRMNFFKPKPTPREQAKAAQKETKSTVRSNQRQIDRDIRDLDRQEKLLLQEIKARAKAPGVDPATDKGLKSQARQLVQLRKQKEKLYETKATLNSVGMQATAMATQVSAVTAVGSVTAALSSANAAMDAKKLGATMAEFQKQTETAKLKEELMNDALADAFDESDVEEEADAVTNQVLAELGVEMDQKMVGLDAPSQVPLTEGESKLTEEEEALMDALPDLKARLDAL